jgi:predicted anti-sigma-YlaC factor YlaD
MAFQNEQMNCTEFEENLSDYLEKTLDNSLQKAVAAHAMKCPLCHSLLNDVKESISICRTMAQVESPMTRLEARILANTAPHVEMQCEDFEEHLTDYLDGFLPAAVFHRWERHAVVCEGCTDLPGTVVRSLAAIVTFKTEELPVPAGLNERILQRTIWADRRATEPEKRSWAAGFGEWVRGLRMPIPIPQLAPVALMLTFGFLFISQSVSADGSLTDVYHKSVQIAEQTYRQSAEAFSRPSAVAPASQAPANNAAEGSK